MANDDTAESEERLERILEAAARVYTALDSRRSSDRVNQGPAADDVDHRASLEDVRPWLDAPRLALRFRTQRSANLAALQFAVNGYRAAVAARSVEVEAPWFLVAAVVTGVGLTNELLAIESAGGRHGG